MVRPENIQSKIAQLNELLDILRRYQVMEFSKIQADYNLRGALERYLYLATQSAIDLAEMLVKQKKLGTVESMAALFETLRDAGIISVELSERLVRMVGFRNTLSHGYAHLDYKIVEAALRSGVSDLLEFLKAVG